jgi:cyclophilin family peptidyl-prolyl cis-trans isomerase
VPPRLAPALAAALLLLPPAAAAENPFVRIATSLGSFEVELCAEVSAACPGDAPTLVANFLRYVDEGAYPATLFVHRVADQPGIVLGGLWFVGENEYLPWERVTPFPAIAQELDPLLLNVRGALGLWPEPYEGVGRSEWFVNVRDNPALDPGVGVFGRVVRHMGVVDAIHALPIYDFPPLLEDVPMIGDLAQGEPVYSHHVYVPSITRVPEPGGLAAGVAAALALAALLLRRTRRCVAGGLALAPSPIAASAANPVARFATALGAFDVELCAAVSARCPGAAPATVANLLRYVDENVYPPTSFIHRRVAEPNRLEGGAFWIGDRFARAGRRAASRAPGCETHRLV